MEKKKVRIMYLLSEKGQKKLLLAGGDGKRKQVAEADITAEALELARVSSEGNAVLNLSDSLVESITGVQKESWGCRFAQKLHEFCFDEPQTAEQLIAFEKERRAKIEKQEKKLAPELEKALDEYEEEKAEREAEEAARKKQRAEEKARRKAEKERLEKEKLEWISEYGSDYLQRAVKLGYDCQRQYVTERAAKEFPEYVVDFDDRAEWRRRVCPSLEALDEVERIIEAGYDAKVVWLTEPPRTPVEEEDDYDCISSFESCEAVMVRGYIGEYYLIKEI